MESDVVIVGAGISGLATALALLDGDTSGVSMIVVDGGPSRLRTAVLGSDKVCELGAGRFSTSLHPRTVALADRLDVELEPFRFRRRYPDNTDISFWPVDFGRLASDKPGFYDALFEHLGSDIAEAFCRYSGYEALGDYRFPRHGAIELVQTHPEAFGGDDYAGTWVAPSGGFSLLANTLRRHLESQPNVTFLSPARARAVRDSSGQAGLEVHIRSRIGPSKISTARVFLAMSPTDVSAISLPTQAVDLPWYREIVNVPLFKGFLSYSEPWWDNLGLEQSCVVTGNELQKLYFDSRKGVIFFYCDSWNSGYWNAHLADGAEEFRHLIFRAIEETIGFKLPQLVNYEDERYAFWPSGVVYLAGENSTSDLTAVTSNIGLVSDALTGNPGWVEGALECAEAAIQGLGS